MLFRLVAALAAGLLAAHPALAQVTAAPPPGTPFEGVVVDAETGQTLPGATVQLAGRVVGDAADAAGRVRLELPSLPDTLVARFVGYATAVVVVGRADVRGGVARATIRLAPQPLSLGEVTVSAEPPGERLWRRVLARRQQLARRMGTYAAEGYSRLVLVRDGPSDVRPFPIRLVEAVSNLTWQVGSGLREEVVGRRRMPAGGPFKWADLGPVVDLYFEDALALDGRAVLSPTHPDALASYAFRIGETFDIDGMRYIDLAVLPRRSGLVSGRIRIVDSLFVIAEADLRVEPGSRSFSLDDFEASYRWTYRPSWLDATVRDSLWLPALFEREGSVRVEVPGTRIPTVRFRQRSILPILAPGAGGAVAGGGRRFRNPAGVYGGRETFYDGRARLRLDSLETRADTLGLLRRVALADLLRPQEGMRFVLGIPGVSKLVGIEVEGVDDE